jgi:nitrate/TMAO reductase-like tetraheme cytochrome c subunit
MNERELIIRNWVLVAIALVIALPLMLGTAFEVTDRPQFCGSACHEMNVFRDAWKAGPHKNLWCSDCHVPRDPVGEAFEKAGSVKENTVHFLGQGDSVFPLPKPPELPDNDRCLSCHKLPAKTASGFQHAVHITKLHCAECHADVGHMVTAASLQAHGMKPTGPTEAEVNAQTMPRRGGGAANIAGHKQVGCGDCHNMGSMGCRTCHTPRHRNNVNRGADCGRCHQPGSSYKFVHPTKRLCSNCHVPPADHRGAPTADCMMCHTRPGVAWTAYHPVMSAAQPGCGCHSLPPDHKMPHTRDCTICHKRVGLTWASIHSL